MLFEGTWPRDKINSWLLSGWCYCFFVTGFYRNLHCRNDLKNHRSRSLLLFSAALEYFWQCHCHTEFNWTEFPQTQKQERKAKRRNPVSFTILQTGNASNMLSCMKLYLVNLIENTSVVRRQDFFFLSQLILFPCLGFKEHTPCDVRVQV